MKNLWATIDTRARWPQSKIGRTMHAVKPARVTRLMFGQMSLSHSSPRPTASSSQPPPLIASTANETYTTSHNMNFSNINLATTFGALYQGTQGQANNIAATRGPMNDTGRHMRRAYAADLEKQRQSSSSSSLFQIISRGSSPLPPEYMPKISKHSRTPSAARTPLKRHTTVSTNHFHPDIIGDFFSPHRS